ncbi:hypothetical protein DFQ07_0164 [Tenacibaculum caenipelagi]|uniref:Uncharacterized protein n=1 Tax=Tenacibaculum caenipelagi TaxID=1325435 RepID=A0A4V3D3I2_9FLAO|nr:hypothetical protein DFQ07_0164 [Tenacibaculum caenipelagi]
MDKKYIWKKEYTLVLVANLVYIIIFYFITNIYTK